MHTKAMSTGFTKPRPPCLDHADLCRCPVVRFKCARSTSASP